MPDPQHDPNPLGVGAALLSARCAQLAQSEWARREEIEQRQRADLVRLATSFAARSQAFADRLAGAGLQPADFAASAALAALPPLSRADLQRGLALPAEAVPANQHPVMTTSTSGSTGEPVTVARTLVNQVDWLAMTARDHAWHRSDLARPSVSVRANVSKIERRRDWGPPISLLGRTGPSVAIPIATDAPRLLALLRQIAPGQLMIYPSTLAALLDAVEASGRPLKGLQRIRSVGETLSPDLARRATALLGCFVTDCYSSQELGVIALQCPMSGLLHIMSESHIVEVVDEGGAPVAEGEQGRLLVTDLRNYATPLIRYAIGDRAIRGEDCPCGRALPTLVRVIGRERNLIRLPDGRRHWPLVGFDRFRELAPVRQYQLIQHGAEEIEVRLGCERALDSGERDALGRHIQASLGHPFALRFSEYDGRLPPAASGKHEEFVCLI